MQLIIYVDPLSIAAQKLKHKCLTDKDFCDIPIVFTPLEEALIYKNLVTIDKKSIELLMQLIFSRIIDNNSNKLNERITHILRIIKQTPLADLSIQYLASKIFISESRLRMHVKESMGVSLHQYIIKHKLLSAITNIVNGTSIQDAAYVSGFTDSSHLNKMMVKTFGINPSMFLRNNQTFSVINNNDSFKFETRLADLV